jgi:hypothetical protein
MAFAKNATSTNEFLSLLQNLQNSTNGLDNIN